VLLFGFPQGYISFIPLKLQAINPHIPKQHDAARHDTTHHIQCVFFAYTPIKAKKKEKRKNKQTRRMGWNAVRVDLIRDDGERREKEGKGKGKRRLRGGEVG
jgi:hypothetical protein